MSQFNLRESWRYFLLTTTHKFFVIMGMARVCCKLMKSAIVHDMSKYSKAEYDGFKKLITVFRNTQYGTPEYSAILEKERDTINLHYSRNKHHPEFHKNGLDDMDFYLLTEMIVDWRASVRKNKNGDIKRSFEINEKRFNIKPEILRILKSI